MKVRITECDRDSYWYSKKIGKIFDVWEHKTNYEVKNKTAKETILFIEKGHCEIIPEEYAYLDIDLPEWWDGRPIYGEAWDCRGEDKEKVYCCGIIQHSKDIYTYECLTDKTKVTTESFRHFKPIPKQQTSAKVVITKDGNTTEVELTADQIERLGIK